MSKVSQYDTRLWEKKGQSRSFPMGHKDVETYLGGRSHSQNPPLNVMDESDVDDSRVWRSACAIAILWSSFVHIF